MTSGKWLNRVGVVKKTALSVLIALVICLSFLFLPAAQAVGSNTGPQTWSLDSKNDKDSKTLPASICQMEKNNGPGDNGQSGSVTISGGTSYIWMADQAAAHDVTFSNGAWVLQIVTDSDWGTKGSKCQIEIGEWNGTTFSSLTPPPQTLRTRMNSNVLIITLFQSSSITVHQACYLSIKVTSLEKASKKHTIYTGEDKYNSYLRSTESDVGYPLPEPSAGILLALGLAGLGTYILVRRKSANKSAST
jgi:hypothetical protein